ncbi:DUF924-domain-containing protein [Clathrospora elynae]|uniref:DUF924-domain-containing protein n=1 Tax=Clathrospora elynae TaxID=706981 RepID=A0A6A5S5Q8_9PLEO|nr:DUF924-domain-containing protein [Clathrospora elynae]
MLTRFAVQTPLRLLTSSLYLSSLRPSSLQYQRAISNSTIRLDPSIFNPTLYKNATDIWLRDVDLSGQGLAMDVAKRWFTTSAVFDEECRNAFAHALDAIGPDKFPQASAQPFIDEIRRVAEEDDDEEGVKTRGARKGKGEEAAWTALSLILLLDQIPRNIYRTDGDLHKVYTHYDRISYALALSLLYSTPVPRPDTHPLFRLSSAHRMWFILPLMHSEEVSAHNLIDEILAEYGGELERMEGYTGSKTFLERQLKAEKSHREILERFGRYPHRNSALGRQSTEEEERFFAEGGATFGVGQQKKEGITEPIVNVE